MHITITDSRFPDDIDDYAGLWVAIRGDEVVLSSPNLREIFDDPRYVAETDRLYPVPRPNQISLPLHVD